SSTTSKLDVQVSGTVNIDPSSRIDVSQKGYLGGFSGDNANPSGRTRGNVSSSLATAGGSYGGFGPASPGTGPFVPLYGDSKEPADLGSGGAGTTGAAGGNGGGLLRLAAGNLVLNGQLLANGGYNGQWGGAGGGIRVDVTGTLSGTGGGSISANGGAFGGG